MEEVFGFRDHHQPRLVAETREAGSGITGDLCGFLTTDLCSSRTTNRKEEEEEGGTEKSNNNMHSNANRNDTQTVNMHFTS